MYMVYEFKDGDLLYAYAEKSLIKATKLVKESYLAGIDRAYVVDQDTGKLEYSIGE